MLFFLIYEYDIKVLEKKHKLFTLCENVAFVNFFKSNIWYAKLTSDMLKYLARFMLQQV